MVVGEKVLITCGENILVCYNVHDGTELWRTVIDHTEAMDEATREKARAEMAYLDGLEKQRGRWAMNVEKLCLMVKEAGGDMKAVLKRPNKKAHHYKLVAPDSDKAFAELLANAEIKELWTTLHKEQEEFDLSYTVSDHGAFWTKEIWARAEKAFDEYDVFFESRWEGWCTEAWPAPVYRWRVRLRGDRQQCRRRGQSGRRFDQVDDLGEVPRCDRARTRASGTRPVCRRALQMTRSSTKTSSS